MEKELNVMEDFFEETPDEHIFDESDDADASISEINESPRVIRQREERKNIERTLPSSHVLKVRADTPTPFLAKAICGCFKDFMECELQAVGPRANWVASKAIIVAKGEMATLNLCLRSNMGFIEPRPIINGSPQTGIRYTLSVETMK